MKMRGPSGEGFGIDLSSQTDVVRAQDEKSLEVV